MHMEEIIFGSETSTKPRVCIHLSQDLLESLPSNVRDDRLPPVHHRLYERREAGDGEPQRLVVAHGEEAALDEKTTGGSQSRVLQKLQGVSKF